MTWAIPVPILVFLGLCSRLRPDVRDRQTVRRQTASSLNAPHIRGGGIISMASDEIVCIITSWMSEHGFTTGLWRTFDKLLGLDGR